MSARSVWAIGKIQGRDALQYTLRWLLWQLLQTSFAKAYRKKYYKNTFWFVFTLQPNCNENLHTLNQQQSWLYEVIKDEGV